MSFGWAVFSTLALLFAVYVIIKLTDKPVPKADTRCIDHAVADGCMRLRQATAATAESVEDMRICGAQLRRTITKEQGRKPGDTRRVGA